MFVNTAKLRPWSCRLAPPPSQAVKEGPRNASIVSRQHPHLEHLDALQALQFAFQLLLNFDRCAFHACSLAACACNCACLNLAYARSALLAESLSNGAVNYPSKRNSSLQERQQAVLKVQRGAIFRTSASRSPSLQVSFFCKDLCTARPSAM